jgi:predicted dehydrogenase
MQPIRVGIVGANAERGWGRDAHLDALRTLAQFTIVAVSARTQALAEQAATVFGATRAFGDSLALAQNPDVDLVVVTVKVPEHRAVVLAALAAGKHVYCEWPLGRDLAEAKEMAAAVRPGIHAVVGLQGLFSPAIRGAVSLIHSGAIGRPRILRVFGSAGAWGNEVAQHYGYLQDKRNGASLETIGGGHTLAAIEALVGPYAEVDARNSTLRKTVRVQGTYESIERTCADHMLVLGLHASGCVSTLEVAGGTADRSASFELVGEHGWLRVTGESPATYQLATLTLTASTPIERPAAATAPTLKGPPANVAEVYAILAEDIRTGTHRAPNFDDAVRLTHLLDAIDRASSSGMRQQLRPDPIRHKDSQASEALNGEPIKK